MKSDGKLLLLDGRHLLYRTFDVFSMLSVEYDGEEIGVGGVYGFLNVSLQVHRRFGGRVMVAWEGEHNFRYRLYPEYKLKPEPTAEKQQFLADMEKQELRLRAVLRAMGVVQQKAVACEADDVLGTVAKKHVERQKGNTAVIYTGDSDLRQMVTKDKSILVAAPGRKGVVTMYDAAAVLEKHGVGPDRIADLKALAGDSSDNIPGVRGIGPKTAAILINTYGDLVSVIKAAEDGCPIWPVNKRFMGVVADNAKKLALYKQLTEIRTDSLYAEIAPKRDKKLVMEYFKAFKFRSLSSPTELMGLMRMGG